MPIYEYRCKDCDAVNEFLMSMSSKEKPTCPVCGSKRMERLLSTFSSGGSSRSGTGN